MSHHMSSRQIASKKLQSYSFPTANITWGFTIFAMTILTAIIIGVIFELYLTNLKTSGASAATAVIAVGAFILGFQQC